MLVEDWPTHNPDTPSVEVAAFCEHISEARSCQQGSRRLSDRDPNTPGALPVPLDPAKAPR